MLLSEKSFQFKIIDALAANQELLNDYKKVLNDYRLLVNELQQLQEKQEQYAAQHDYNSHLFHELEEAKLKEGEQETIEQELDQLNNAELIKSNLSESVQLLNNEELGIIELINGLKTKLQNISTYSKNYNELFGRVNSVDIELKDILVELENYEESIIYNPLEIERLNDKLQLIYDLLKKHNVATISELLEIQEKLSNQIYEVENSSEIISKQKDKVAKVEVELKSIATQIHNSRKEVIPDFLNQLHQLLDNLSMSNSRFQFNLSQSSEFLSNGMDELEVLFSANKGSIFGELKKVASGGEMSRIMLSVKAILAKYLKLPTIIFDEIDTGVSGEVSNKIGDIMQEMSKDMQVLSITHLPQIAGKGGQHFKVYKQEENDKVRTSLVQLSENDRIVEIAEMLGGKELTDSAVNHAKELLN